MSSRDKVEAILNDYYENIMLPANEVGKLSDERGDEIINVGDHRRGIVEELEKAHLYIDELNTNIKQMHEEYQKSINDLEERIRQLEKLLESRQ